MKPTVFTSSFIWSVREGACLLICILFKALVRKWGNGLSIDSQCFGRCELQAKIWVDKDEYWTIRHLLFSWVEINKNKYLLQMCAVQIEKQVRQC